VILIITLILALIFLPTPWNVVVIVIAAIAELSLAVFGVRYSRHRRAQVGPQTMIGMLAQALSPLEPSGQVKVDGEIWSARGPSTVRTGDTVRVTRVDGLTLEVEPAAQ
jgi:membrane protein implicated in regulation of membrane protease activity